MNPMRERAKQHLPTVLLTLSSIVQALALELLWTRITELDALLIGSLVSVDVWLQVGATFTGIVLVWVLYANNLMRFRWVPDTLDSLAPFLVGVLQFCLVEWISPHEVGKWLMAMAVIFITMTMVMQRIMRAARLDGDNDLFFRGRSPATWRDFIGVLGPSVLMFLAGVVVYLTDYQGVGISLMLLATWGLLLFQLYRAHLFWASSVDADRYTEPKPSSTPMSLSGED